MTANLTLNKTFAFLRDRPERYLVLMGGAGSGKSYAVAQDIILRCFQRQETFHGLRHFLVVRKVARTLRHSVFALLKHVIQEAGLREYFEINKTEMSFECITGCRIILQGMDDPEKIKSIHGITDIWCEEASELSENDLNQLNLRLRGRGLNKRIILTFNPVSTRHWLKKRFFDNIQKNAYTSITTYRDNPFLDNEYREELERYKEISAYHYQVYALGQWGQFGNQVLTNYAIHDFDYTAADLDDVSAGMDFGYHNPSAIVIKGWKDGELYVTDELYMTKTTNAELIEAAEGWLDKETLCIADSAEPDRIREWKNAGFYVRPAKKGKDSVRSSLDFLRRHRIHVHATRCPNLAREIQDYQYKTDKDGEALEDPAAINDHAIDALRYAIEPERSYRTASIEELGYGD